MNCGCTASINGSGPYTNSGLSVLQWGAMTSYGPQTITHTTNTASFEVSNAGLYLFNVQLTTNGTANAAQCYLGLQYSTNGSTWSTTAQNTCAWQQNNQQTMTLTVMQAMAANSYAQIVLSNGSSASFSVSTTASTTFFNMCRVC